MEISVKWVIPIFDIDYTDEAAMRYTLRQLEVFLATAHFENVSRAADHLSMSACTA